MTATLPAKATVSLVLRAATAADLMTPNPVSIRQDASLDEAVALLTGKGISAAPVIDEGGRPVGVLSRSDILVHDRHAGAVQTAAYYQQADLQQRGVPAAANTGRAVASAQVRDVMTPVVFSVPPDSTALRVVQDMMALQVHRLFVVDPSRVLIGVISALDILRQLRPQPEQS